MLQNMIIGAYFSDYSGKHSYQSAYHYFVFEKGLLHTLVDKYAKDAVKPQLKHKVHTLRFHPNIGDADRSRLIDKAKSFLSAHDQVKVFVQLRGREKSRPLVALEFLNGILAELEPFGSPANPPRPDNLASTLNPRRHK